jgi:hypothetical protein
VVRAKVNMILQRPKNIAPRAKTVTTLLWSALHASIRPHFRMSHAIHLIGNVPRRTLMVLALVAVKSIQVLSSHVPRALIVTQLIHALKQDQLLMNL